MGVQQRRVLKLIPRAIFVALVPPLKELVAGELRFAYITRCYSTV
jgi:hypothetical protein